MKPSHTIGPVFDEANLVSAAGLVPALRLAESAGMYDLLDGLTVPSPNAGQDRRGGRRDAGRCGLHRPRPAAPRRDGPVVRRGAGALDTGHVPALVHPLARPAADGSPARGVDRPAGHPGAASWCVTGPSSARLRSHSKAQIHAGLAKCEVLVSMSGGPAWWRSPRPGPPYGRLSAVPEPRDHHKEEHQPPTTSVGRLTALSVIAVLPMPATAQSAR